jgi:D-glycero-beta-D-manno-heptose-7-phosphate kinase
MSKILLLGDNCIDEYQYGNIDRISPEAPVPVFKLINKEEKAGMAANVKLNLSAFGLDVVDMLGDKSKKTRLIDQRSRQHVIRIDQDIISTPLDIVNLPPLDFDAIVISDYCKGFISYELVEHLIKTFKGPIFIDTKKRDLARFNGCIVKINEQEYNQRISNCHNIIVTLGSKGAVHKQLNEENYYNGLDVEVVDVCGAGDTFLSALVFKYLESKNIGDSIKFANLASSVSVQHRGVYVLTTDDINQIKS